MTIDKDKLLILGVVAVLGFFLWKSRRDSEAKRLAAEAAASGSTFTGDRNSVNSIINALGLDATARQTVASQANWAVACKNGYASKSDAQRKWVDGISSKAQDSGITYAQQAVIEGLWVAFCGENVVRDQNAYETYKATVLAM